MSDETGIDEAAGLAAIEVDPRIQRLMVLEKYWNEIRDAEQECIRLEEKVKEAAEKKTAATKKLDSAVGYLRRIARESPFQVKLFSEPNRDDTPPSESTSNTSAEDESWKTLNISELNLSPKLEEKLREVGIETIGQLGDWTSTKPLTDIPGVGSGKSKLIEDAWERFWFDWRENRQAHALRLFDGDRDPSEDFDEPDESEDAQDEESE